MYTRLEFEMKLAQEHTADFVQGLDIGIAGATDYIERHPATKASADTIENKLFTSGGPYNIAVLDLIGTHRYYSRISALMVGCEVGIQYVISPPVSPLET